MSPTPQEHIDHAERLLEANEVQADPATAIEAGLHIGISIAQSLQQVQWVLDQISERLSM